MCAVSMVGDDYYKYRLPPIWPSTWPEYPTPTSPPISSIPGPSKEDFDRLKDEVEQMKRELTEARKQDVEDGEPDCEMDDKVKVVKEIARLVGVDLGDVFPNG